tara:strand:- start:1217 stop:2230 length:1014 start_codon:yes stop_codon:yes gene_type:complete
MERIPNLYEGINFSTIPKCISDELKTHGDIRESISIRNEKGKMITKEGNFMRPLFMFFDYNDLNFYVNSKYLFHLFKLLDLGVCFDTKYNKLNRNNIDIYYNEYSKGFNKGYNEFENSIKDSNTIFSTSNEQIAFKIYSQIKQDGFTNKIGDFKLVNNSLVNKDIEDKICLENNIKIIYQLTESNFFESGINGGKFYKAWELILNNPTVFEPIFLKDIIAKTQPTQQIEIDKNIDEVLKELHNDIFKFNAFEVFEVYKEKKEITFQSRTDLRVIFDLLKADNLLVDTIELKHYIKWINKEYFNNDISELKKQNLKSKPNIKRTNDYILYRDATLKQP